MTKPKSPIAYPWYALAETIKLATLIEDKGAGRLTSEAIAVEMSSSITSGFFQSRLRSGRLFGLLAQRAEDVWATTERAKRILRPRSPEDRAQALREAFVEVPLFRAVMEKYAGRPLPVKETLTNILEHDFQVIASRSAAAADILLASAREAGLVQTGGERSYLSVPNPEVEPAAPEEPPTLLPTPHPVAHPRESAPKTLVQLWLTSDDLEAMSPEDIQEVFGALGRIEVARSRARSQGQK